MAGSIEEQLLKELEARSSNPTPDKGEYKVEDLMGTINLDFLGENSIIRAILLDYNNEDINDIKYDGFNLTIESGEKGKYKIVVDEVIFKEVNKLMENIEIANDLVLNISRPYLDLDVMVEGTDVKLRFSVLHETLTNIKGIKSFAIRRNRVSEPFITDDNIVNSLNGDVIAESYIKSMISLNKKPNIVIAGETGSGKTELQKYVVGKITKSQGVVSIQDTNDAALKKLYPQHDITEIFSNKFYSLSDGIKTALRYNPDWVIVAEIRGEEVESFIEAMETGHSGITTIHASSAFNTLDRINNLIMKYSGTDKMNTIESLIDIVIHIKVYYVPKQVEGNTVYVKKRLISEIYEVKNKTYTYKYQEK
ncbi:MAG: ATPase, T2SS/T4P/T4SS family [Mycoplasmatales bacterium]